MMDEPAAPNAMNGEQREICIALMRKICLMRARPAKDFAQPHNSPAGVSLWQT